jgi:hypothetical protein
LMRVGASLPIPFSPGCIVYSAAGCTAACAPTSRVGVPAAGDALMLISNSDCKRDFASARHNSAG